MLLVSIDECRHGHRLSGRDLENVAIGQAEISTNGTRLDGRHIIIGNIPEDEKSAFRRQKFANNAVAGNPPGNKTGGKQPSYRIKE